MNIRYDEINYADIITFIYTVRFGTVSQAAKALAISQPAASKRIASLEKKYGLVLFQRQGRGLQLTEAGKIFYEGMQKGLDDILSAFKRAADAQANPIRKLTIGTDGFFDLPLLYDIVTTFNNESRETRAEIVSYPMNDENCADLLNGHADLLIAPNAWFSPLKDKVDHLRIAAFQFSILVPDTNPMFRQENLTLFDLKDIPLTVAHVNKNSPYVRAIETMFLKKGIEPQITYLIDRENICMEILQNTSVAIASSAFFRQKNSREENFYREKIHVYPIAGEYYPVSFIWLKNNDNPAIVSFLNIYQKMILNEQNRKIIENCYLG